MLLKVNEESYNKLKEKMSNGNSEDAIHCIGFLKDSLIGQVLENKDNELLEINLDDSIEEDKIIFIENEEEIFESYMYDFLSCMVIN